MDTPVALPSMTDIRPPLPAIPSPARPRQGNVSLRTVSVLGGLSLVAVVAVGLLSSSHRSAPAADRPFAELAVSLREFCPNVDAPRRSLLIAIKDGDAVCAAGANAALDGLGFTTQHVEQALVTGDPVRRGQMQLSAWLVADGMLIGIDASD
jgi:hypothetical protein